MSPDPAIAIARAPPGAATAYTPETRRASPGLAHRNANFAPVIIPPCILR